MKKVLAKIVTVILVVAMCLTTFTACGLISTNNQADMAQTVAKVQIKDENGNALVEVDEVKKSEMLSGFMSYGYVYVNSYGYSVSDTYQMILDNLVQNRIIIQYARVQLAKLYNENVAKKDSGELTPFVNYFVKNVTPLSGNALHAMTAEGETKEANFKSFLTKYEIAQAEYNVKVNVNSMIDSYVEEDEEEEDEREDTTFTARATPNEDEKDELLEYELLEDVPTEYDYKVADVVLEKGVDTLKNEYKNTYELNMAVYAAYHVDLSTPERIKAFNKAIKDLKEIGLVSESAKYDVKDEASVLELDYFKKNRLGQYEAAIVAKYEDSLLDEVREKLTDEALWAQYAAEYNTQMANYKNDRTAYETALEAVSEDQFVVCNPYSDEKYGYVANLLIGFSEEQTAMLEEFAAKPGKSDAQVKEYRAELLKQLTVKDQRETWVQSSFGKFENNDFIFEDKYLLSKADSDPESIGSKVYNKLNKFIGDIYGANSYEDENEDKVMETVWTFENVVPTSNSFGSFVSEYLSLAGITEGKYFANNGEFGMIDNFDEAKRNALEDLIYAFSTDPGSLGNYYGYLYSPVTSKTKYVKEFADASAKVVEAGVGAYTIVATDFGYHVIVCTKVVDNAPYTIDEAGKNSFIADLENDSTVASKYKEIKFNRVSSDEVGRLASDFINDFLEKDVEYFEKTYSDLIEKTEDSAK